MVELIKQTCQSNPKDEEACLALKFSVSIVGESCVSLCLKSLTVWAAFNSHISLVQQKQMRNMHEKKQFMNLKILFQ